jgi:RNA polymerase sigma-70 factor (ECF subfamily)
VSNPPADYERADEADAAMMTAPESGPPSVAPGHRAGSGPWPGEPGAPRHSTLDTGSEFAEVYHEHCRAIFYLALRLLGDPQKAEDATHDVFLKAFRKMDRFRRESTWRTWLYRIAINHCRNLQQAWHDRHIFTNADDALWETAAARTDSPLRVLETKELGQRIQKTLDRLPAEYRLLLLLVADEHLSYAEVGALTDQTPDAVRGKLHRARKAFAVLFDKSA